jgi:4-amino-4-deoxy-L-arabinose transferase-like glycosyltransferase
MAFLAVLVLNVALTSLIVRQVKSHQDHPFDLDEANHANGGLALFMELKAKDLTGAFREFYGQSFYPPGFAWVQALAFSLWTPSALVARLLSAACFFVALLLIYAICLELDVERKWLVGLAAAGLTMTVQPLLINSALVMKETPGLLITILLLWAYLRALKQPTRRRLVMTSLLLMGTFLTKYTYGLVAVLPVSIVELSLLWEVKRSASPDPVAGSTKSAKPARSAPYRASGLKRILFLFGPFLLGMLLWFARPGNVAGFFAYATAQPPGQQWFTVESLLFYPRSIALQQTPSPYFALITAAALIWSVTRVRKKSVRLLLTYFAVGMAVMTVNMPKNPRFIATFVPAAHILTGMMIERTIARQTASKPPLRTALSAALAAILLCSILSLPTVFRRLNTYPAQLTVAYETDPRLNNLSSWIADEIGDDERFFIVNYWDQFGPQTMAWELGRQAAIEERSDVSFADVQMPSALLEPASPQRIAALKNQIDHSGAGYLLLLEGGPWGAPFWPEYTAAMQDSLTYVSENRFDIDVPLRSEENDTLNIKAIIYSLD